MLLLKPGLDNQPKALSDVTPRSSRLLHLWPSKFPQKEKTLLLPLKAAKQIRSSCTISGSASERDLFAAFVDKLN